jgi:RNA polymerase sigma factor (TIGR02999 family)
MSATLSSLVAAADGGDSRAAEELFALLYSELQVLAKRQLGRLGGRRLAMGASSLLHQAYVAMVAREDAAFPDQARFMGYAARVMRGLIIDHARQRGAKKRGAEFEIKTLDAEFVADESLDPQLLEEVDAALNELHQIDRSLSEVVDLKFFCGFTFQEIASMHGVSERTVERRWERARLYLHQAMRGTEKG